jgi:Uma2 family endonuclease
MSTIKDEVLQIVRGPELPDETLRQRLAAVVRPDQHPAKMTYDEFLAWADEDTLAEWVQGEVIMHSPANNRHQDIVGFLDGVMRIFVETRQVGIIRITPFQMKITRSGREPDLIFIAKKHLERLKDTYLDGPADLVVEIISPESIGRDRGDKFKEYEEAGVPEYWLFDPDRTSAEFYRLNAGGRYQIFPPDAEGIYHAVQIPGFWLRVDWLWQEPLPEVDEILLEIGGEEYANRLIDRLRQRGFLK